LAEYRSLGNIAGLCLLHGGEEFGLRLPLYFSRHVYKYLLGREVSFVDYAYYDPQEYEALSNLLAQTNATLSATPDRADQPLSEEGLLEWDDTVGVFGAAAAERRPVTARNATAYAAAKARWEMVGKVEAELSEMRRGVLDVIPQDALAGLTADDLQLLLTGKGSASLSMDDWRSAVKFEDLRSAEVRSADKDKAKAAAAGAAGAAAGARLAAFAEVFWQALEGMTPEQRIDLAFFSTASMTVLDTLTVNLRDVERTEKGGDLETISARTCTAELNIPDYADIYDHDGDDDDDDDTKQTTAASRTEGGGDGEGEGEEKSTATATASGGGAVLRERLLMAVEMGEVLGFTSV